eukprot:TRINITY_DN5668_c0_g1_i2.p1 TRINITY_DN5668_c0_g1~~TRINITY_DN5668_c0_g1_i2.p1  ORF type:complete len:853 (+),score=213.75 TRINITY_DN5668_c0_g1_i2:97-2655(+)
MTGIRLDAVAQLQAVMEPCKVDPAFRVKGPVMFAAVLERVTSKEKAKMVLVTIDYKDLLVSSPSGEVTRRLPLATMNLVSIGQIDHKKQGRLPQILFRSLREDTNEEVDLVLNFVIHDKTLPPCNSVDYFVNCVVTAAKVISGRSLNVVRSEGSISRNANLRKASSSSVKTPSFKRQPVPSEIHTEGESEVGSTSPWVVIRHRASGMHLSALEDGRIVLSNGTPGSFRIEQHEMQPGGMQMLHHTGKYVNPEQLTTRNSSFLGLRLGKKNNDNVWHLTSQGILWELRKEVAVRPLGGETPANGHFLELSKDAKDTDIHNMALEYVQVGVPSSHIDQIKKKEERAQQTYPEEQHTEREAMSASYEVDNTRSETPRAEQPQQPKQVDEAQRREKAGQDEEEELAQRKRQLERARREKEVQMQEEELRRLEEEDRQRKAAGEKYDEELRQLRAEIEAEKERELRELMEERDRLREAKERRVQERQREKEREHDRYSMASSRSCVSRREQVMHTRKQGSPVPEKHRDRAYEDTREAKEARGAEADKESDIPHRSVTNATPVSSESGFSAASKGPQTQDERENMLCYGYEQFYRKHDKSRLGSVASDAKKAMGNEAKAYRQLLQQYPACPIKDADFLRPDAVGDIKREVKYLRELIQGMKPRESGKPLVKDNKYLISLCEKQDAPKPWHVKGTPTMPTYIRENQEPLLVTNQKTPTNTAPRYQATPYFDLNESNSYRPPQSSILPPEAIRWASPHVFVSGSSQAPSFAQLQQNIATQTPLNMVQEAYSSASMSTTPLVIQRTTQQTQAPSEHSSLANAPSYITIGGTIPPEQPDRPGTWRPKDWTYIDRSEKGTEVL